MKDTQLEEKIEFIYTLERMKNVYRRTKLLHEARYENDAEHSFHIAAMAYILRDFAPEDVDFERVLLLLLYHDVVEIEAGDTFAYDAEGNKSKLEREIRAADSLFGILPEASARKTRALWDEFEAQETPESHFALAMDRMQPILLNVATGGNSWNEHAVKMEDVLVRMEPIKRYPALYDYMYEKVSAFFE